MSSTNSAGSENIISTHSVSTRRCRGRWSGAKVRSVVGDEAVGVDEGEGRGEEEEVEEEEEEEDEEVREEGSEGGLCAVV